MQRKLIYIGGKIEKKKERHKCVFQTYSVLQKPYVNYLDRKIINHTASASKSCMLLNCSDRKSLSFISSISSEADPFLPGDSLN